MANKLFTIVVQYWVLIVLFTFQETEGHKCNGLICRPKDIFKKPSFRNTTTWEKMKSHAATMKLRTYLETDHRLNMGDHDTLEGDNFGYICWGNHCIQRNDKNNKGITFFTVPETRTKLSKTKPTRYSIKQQLAIYRQWYIRYHLTNSRTRYVKCFRFHCKPKAYRKVQTVNQLNASVTTNNSIPKPYPLLINKHNGNFTLVGIKESNTTKRIEITTQPSVKRPHLIYQSWLFKRQKHPVIRLPPATRILTTQQRIQLKNKPSLPYRRYKRETYRHALRHHQLYGQAKRKPNPITTTAFPIDSNHPFFISHSHTVSTNNSNGPIPIRLLFMQKGYRYFKCTPNTGCKKINRSHNNNSYKLMPVYHQISWLKLHQLINKIQQDYDKNMTYIYLMNNESDSTYFKCTPEHCQQLYPTVQRNNRKMAPIKLTLTNNKRDKKVIRVPDVSTTTSTTSHDNYDKPSKNDLSQHRNGNHRLFMHIEQEQPHHNAQFRTRLKPDEIIDLHHCNHSDCYHPDQKNDSDTLDTTLSGDNSIIYRSQKRYQPINPSTSTTVRPLDHVTSYRSKLKHNSATNYHLLNYDSPQRRFKCNQSHCYQVNLQRNFTSTEIEKKQDCLLKNRIPHFDDNGIFHCNRRISIAG